MHLANLRDLYQQQVARLHQAETDYLQLLPTLQKAAFSPVLAGTLRSHVQQSREHAPRLERILNSCPAREANASSVAGLLQSCLDPSRDPDAAPDVRDAWLEAGDWS